MDVRRVVLVEDDDIKGQQISSFVAEVMPYSIVTICRSYQSGLAALMQARVDLLLLDMSLPTFDTSPDEDGYNFDAFAGKAILQELHRKGRVTPAVVITQFVTFGTPPDLTTLGELREALSREFPDIYKGTVYYSSADPRWRDDLRQLLEAL